MISILQFCRQPIEQNRNPLANSANSVMQIFANADIYSMLSIAVFVIFIGYIGYFLATFEQPARNLREFEPNFNITNNHLNKILNQNKLY